MITPNPVRSAAGTVYLLEVDGTAAAALALGPALRDLLADERLVACPRCSAAATTVARDMSGRSLPPGELRCGSCEHRWPSPDRDRVAASWRRRAALASAAARAALPRRIARREVELVDAADLDGWARLGIADALLGRAPAHYPRPNAPDHVVAYAAGWIRTMATLTLTNSGNTMMTDDTSTTPAIATTPPIQIEIGGLIFSFPCDQIAAALAEAQGELEALTKGKAVEVKAKDGGKGYSYKYADLAETLSVCRPKLSAHGIAILQPVVTENRGVEVSTILMHKSGQWVMAKPLYMPTAGNAQAIGSAITYARRYQLLPMVGLAPEDDDGKQATDQSEGWGDRKPAQRPARVPKPAPTADPFLSKGSKAYTAITAQVKELATLLGEETGDVWAEALRRTAVSPRFEHNGKTIDVKGPGQLRESQGRFVSVYLTKALGEAVAKAAREAAGEDDEPDFDEALDELDGLVGHPGAES